MVSGGYGGAKASGSVKEILILLGAVVVFILLLPKIIAYLVKSSAKEGSELIQDFPLPEFGLTEFAGRTFAKVGSALQAPELGISEKVASFGDNPIPELGISEGVASIGDTLHLGEWGISEQIAEIGEYKIPEMGISEGIASTGKALKFPELGISEWFARL